MIANDLVDWHRRFCENPACPDGVWIVKKYTCLKEVWLAAREFGARSWAITETLPTCPSCDSALVTEIEIEEGLGAGDENEEGLLFDFIRSLDWNGTASSS